MKTGTQILLSLLIIIKIILGSVFIYQAGLTPVFADGNILSEEQKEGNEKTENNNEQKQTEEKIDLNFLIQKKVEYEEEEQKISKKRLELLAIQEDINDKIIKLTKLREEIRAERTKEQAAEEQQFKHLIKVYSAMKPQNAADLIERLDIKLAIELLSKMKGDDVGKILSFVKVEKAAKISEGLIKRD